MITSHKQIKWFKKWPNNTELIASNNVLMKDLQYYEISMNVYQSELVIKHIFYRDIGQYMCVYTTNPKLYKYIVLYFEGNNITF